MSNYKTYLRKQPNYDEITGYIHFGQDRITYPDRSATFIRDSPYLGIYDGMGPQELEEQEQQIEKEKLKEISIKQLANDTGATRALVELSSAGTQTNLPSSSSSAGSQTNIPTASSGTQANVNTTTSDAQTDPYIFDMSVDDDKDNYLYYLAAERAKKRQVLRKKKATIIRIVKKHLGTEVDTIPYMPNDDIADDATVDYGDQDDRDTVNYGSDIDVDDVVLENRVDKRKRETEDKKEKKPKIKEETKPIIKEEGKISKKGIKKDKTLVKQKNDDDDIQISGLKINRTTDMDFWNEASAREMRSQLNLRFPGKVGDWAFKTRLQLLNIIKDKIKKKEW
jgi:hypothetical protein